MTGFDDPDIHGTAVFGLNRLSAPNSGRSPQVELALTSSAVRCGRASLPSRASSPSLGCATADAVTPQPQRDRQAEQPGDRLGRCAVGHAGRAGADWWKENATADADTPAALSSAGCR